MVKGHDAMVQLFDNLRKLRFTNFHASLLALEIQHCKDNFKGTPFLIAWSWILRSITLKIRAKRVKIIKFLIEKLFFNSILRDYTMKYKVPNQRNL